MMRKLDWYISKTVLLSIALVTLMLMGLQLFILSVSEINMLGKGQFGIVNAFFYIALKMPFEVYLFFPMASLLGTMVGLGLLANHHELIVMQAAGKSVGMITMTVLKMAVLLILFVSVLGEFVFPRLSDMATDIKMNALSRSHVLRTSHGIWVRYKDNFINISEVSPTNDLLNVTQYTFNSDQTLIKARFIKTIHFTNHHWYAHDIKETLFHDKRTVSKQIKQALWPIPLNINMLTASKLDSKELTIFELHQYIQAKKNLNQPRNDLKFMLWQRLIQPFSTLVMMMLAIPFIFGSLRTVSIGSRIMVGVGISFIFHILNRILGPFAQVYELPPELIAITPTLVFAIVSLYLIHRIHRW